MQTETIKIYRRKFVSKLCNWCYKKERLIGAYCSRYCKEKKAEANKRYWHKKKRGCVTIE